ETDCGRAGACFARPIRSCTRTLATLSIPAAVDESIPTQRSADYPVACRPVQPWERTLRLPARRAENGDTDSWLSAEFRPARSCAARRCQWLGIIHVDQRFLKFLGVHFIDG